MKPIRTLLSTLNALALSLGHKVGAAVMALFIVNTLYSQVTVNQTAITSITTSPTQAIINYTSTVPCSIQVADMNRAISIAAATGNGGQVVVQTRAPHGLVVGSTVYIQGTSYWDGWHAVTAVSSTSSLQFASSIAGSASSGTVGVLIDDVNPSLFLGSNLDTRPGNIQSYPNRTFVVGTRTAQIASDGARYTRSLQAYSRHHATLNCGTQTLNQDFQTANIPRGDTHNEGLPADRSHPGQYAYPTIQWANQAQSLIDPLSGLRSVRATAPQGMPSPVQVFSTAIDGFSAWRNPSGPLTQSGGVAVFGGPSSGSPTSPQGCNLATCPPLFLRATTLLIPGGATYAPTSTGNSLDWIRVTITKGSIGSPCTGDTCKLETCLTVNGVNCASVIMETSLTTTPTTYTLGTGNMMDLWQGNGSPQISRVDVSRATGIVNYNAATKQLALASGNVFNTRWIAGSAITVAGVEYSIAAIQNERLLTLTYGPAGNLAGVSYSANNFGILLWKKRGDGGPISIGYTTFTFGSSPMGTSTSSPTNPCSSLVTAAGVPGYNCFFGNELYFVAADGSDVRDLGLIGLSYYSDGRFSNGYGCGSSNQQNQFDPQNGDAWYCIVPLYFDVTRITLVQAQYMGAHSRGTPGQKLPDCSLNQGVQPCVKFTVMQPNKQDSLSQSGTAFNPELATSGFPAGYWFFGGISNDGDAMFSLNAGSQDTLGWGVVVTLGDRTPTGTTANSVRVIAAASTYRHAPLSWCTIHNTEVPDSGWTGMIGNNYTVDGPSGTYTMTMTGPPLNKSVGAAGGLASCPPNPFGVTGNVCTTITVAGQPVSQATGQVMQNVQVGDRITIGAESLRVLAISGPTQFTVQRGYNATVIGNQTSSTLTMACGTFNQYNAAIGLWNYRNDPYGLNANFSTIINDPTEINAHHFTGTGVSVTAGGAPWFWPFCPPSLGSLGECLQVRLGNLVTAATSPQIAIAINPPFDSRSGLGDGNQVDSHPGPCFTTWCMDARPLDGGSSMTLGSAAAPFTLVSGQLWKVSGAQSLLNRKILTTFAYAGRWPLVDISGPGSAITTTSQDAYKYCYANVAGECRAGSHLGDVYVNAPFVDYPYCSYPGIAIQPDDITSICIGDLGTYTGNVVQYSVTAQDVVGASLRKMGSAFAKWNQFDVYWNTFPAPNGALFGSLARWLEGVRSDDLITTMPPFPVVDNVVRSTFIPIAVSTSAQTGAQTAIVEFGYAENGPANAYYCTSRQETCVATAGAGIGTGGTVGNGGTGGNGSNGANGSGGNSNPLNPFSFERSETFSRVPCSGGCSIVVPVLSQRVLYYRWKYFDQRGNEVSTGSANAVVTP
jgi:hypothetical protein